ncbi:MAG TPA: hypothetical protein VG056_08545 [Pirellulales bacterium]|jgi:hypothetical protein|nr:hypothetical protein [Pirellulales bacterium]
MSYDLNFWRYTPGISLPNDDVYRRLCDGEQLAGLEDLPITEIVSQIEDAFSDWERLDEVTFDGGGRGGFQLFTTAQFVRVDCYALPSDTVNRFIEILHGFGCPLYDPQVGRRFDQK